MIKPLLCNTRVGNPELSAIRRTRDNCMNTRKLTTVVGTFTVCPACDMWETEKNWKKGQEKKGWQTPYIKLKKAVMLTAFTLSMLMSSFLVYLYT